MMRARLDQDEAFGKAMKTWGATQTQKEEQ